MTARFCPQRAGPAPWERRVRTRVPAPSDARITVPSEEGLARVCELNYDSVVDRD